MADSVFKDCPEGEYTKVATAVIGGFLWRVKAGANVRYHYVYKVTGGAAPTLFADAVMIFKDDDESDNVVELTYNELVDVYIWCTGGDGRVRVDV
jgi:hypothetical protein